MSDLPEIDWEARLRAAVEQTIAARDARRVERAELKVRRDAGLGQRHARKLRGNRGTQRGRGTAESDAPPPTTGGDMPYPPACCAVAPDGLCEQHRQVQRAALFQGPRVRGRGGSRVIGEAGTAKEAKEPEPEVDR